MLEQGRLRATSHDGGPAFEAIAIAKLDESYRLAALILRDPVEAEDATHDAFVLAWRRWSTLRDQSRFDAWFGRILVNVCRDRLRSRRRWSIANLSDQFRDGRGDLAEPIANRDAIERAFVCLSADHRIAIVLRYYLDLTIDEIADRVGVPEGTVKSRLHHAVRELRVQLAQQTGEVLP